MSAKKFVKTVIEMLKCVASDIDGTLLGYASQKLSDKLISQIRELYDLGVRFVAASGRPYSNLRRLFAPVQDIISYVAENGALCVHNGETVHKDIIEHKLAMEVSKDIIEKPGCEILLSTPRINILQPKSRKYADHVKNISHYDFETVDDITKINEDVIKLAVCEFGGIGKCEDYFKEKYSDRLAVVTSGNIWMDFMNKETNKGSALEKLLAVLSISPDDTIAFGDQFNDVEMLTLSGCGYAMESCADGVSDFADKTCKKVEDVLEEELIKLRKSNTNV